MIPTAVGIILALVLACNNTEPDPILAQAQVELERHRALWVQARSSDYTYEYQALCECSDNLDQAVKVTVSDGGIESVVYVESGMVPAQWGGGPVYHTPDSLFDVIQDAITAGADLITVSYNSEFGYPANIEIDYDINATDDEYTAILRTYLTR